MCCYKLKLANDANNNNERIFYIVPILPCLCSASSSTACCSYEHPFKKTKELPQQNLAAKFNRDLMTSSPISHLSLNELQDMFCFVKIVQLTIWKLREYHSRTAPVYYSIIFNSFHLTEHYWFHIFEQNYRLPQLISQNWCCSTLEQVSGAEPSVWQRPDHKTYGSKLGGKTTIERENEPINKKNNLCRAQKKMLLQTFNESEFI